MSIKPKVKLTDLNRRHRDFLHTCMLILNRSKGLLKPKELAVRAVKSRAKGYYVGEDYAYRLVLGHEKYGKMPTRNSARLMCIELADRVAVLKSENPGLATMPALKRVMESGKASRYFMSAKTAQNLIERHYKQLLLNSLS